MPLANPKTLEEFLRRPTIEEWQEELEAGWKGPDGSSWSFDNVLGVLIGETGWGYHNCDLAANRHDWYYRLGRRLGLPGSWRKAADEWYRDRIIEQVDEHHVLLLPLTVAITIVNKAVRIATFRYWGLRLLGRSAWTSEPRPPGGWPRRPARKMGGRKWKRKRRELIDAKWAEYFEKKTT